MKSWVNKSWFWSWLKFLMFLKVHTFKHELSNHFIPKQWGKVNDYRSSRAEVFCKKGILRNFAKFTGKHLCQSLFLKKIVGPRPAILLKRRLWHRYFPANFAKFLRTPFLTEHLQWLLLWLVDDIKRRLILELFINRVGLNR